MTDESLFSPEARREAGRQLSPVQVGLDPDHWKPFNEVGSGTKEIIVDQQDKALAKARYDGVIAERKAT